MARPASFNKRENEKKKLSKRLEKQKKKEDRASASPRSFDDMIAYVDENGMIHDTPPEVNKTDRINAEDIMVSVPKKAEEDAIRKGRVDYFNQDKGYGFIKDMETTEKYFFHVKNAPPGMREGLAVQFEFQKGTGKREITNIKTDKPELNIK